MVDGWSKKRFSDFAETLHIESTYKIICIWKIRDVIFSNSCDGRMVVDGGGRKKSSPILLKIFSDEVQVI